MKPKYEPCPGNAPGPFYVVRDGCMACQAPIDAAPDLMDWGGEPGSDHHCRFQRQPETEEEVQRAIRAVGVCCTLAVRYVGTDKPILDRIGTPQACDVMPESDGLFQ